MARNLHWDWAHNNFLNSLVKKNISCRCLDLVFTNRVHLAVIKLIPLLSTLHHHNHTNKIIKQLNYTFGPSGNKNVIYSLFLYKLVLKLNQKKNYLCKSSVVTTTHSTIMIAHCIQLVTKTRLVIFIFFHCITRHIKIINWEVNKSLQFVLQKPIVRKSF